jgi:hypothetical protein
MLSATCWTVNPVGEVATNCSAARPLANVCEPGAPFGASLALAALADGAMALPSSDFP